MAAETAPDERSATLGADRDAGLHASLRRDPAGRIELDADVAQRAGQRIEPHGVDIAQFLSIAQPFAAGGVQRDAVAEHGV